MFVPLPDTPPALPPQEIPNSLVPKIVHPECQQQSSPTLFQVSQDNLAHNNHHRLYKNLKILIESVNRADQFHMHQFIEDVMYQEEKGHFLHDSLAHFLGVLIYELDHCPIQVSRYIQTQSMTKATQSIENHFQNSIKKIQQRLESTHAIYSKTGIQNPNIVYQHLIPLEIAALLIPSTGILNDALIPLVIKEFVDAYDPTKSTILRSNLHFLHHSLILQAGIADLRLPDQISSSTSLLMKCTLHLPSTTKLTDLHLKQCILTALLAQLRQSKSGSCFASVLAIELQALDPLHAFEDFWNLLQANQLIRCVDNVQQSFPFLLKWGRDSLMKSIVLNPKGLLLSSPKRNIYLWNDPSIQMVCDCLHYPSAKKAIQDWLNKQDIPKEGLKLTIETLIRELAIDEKIQFFTEACIGFSAYECHPILAAWENSLAGMAEGEKDSLLKSALIKSVEYIFKKCLCKAPLKNPALSLLYLTQAIQKRSQYLYDPTFTLANHSKCQGAFLLYDSKYSPDFKNWQHIADQDQFQAFLREILDDNLAKECPELMKFKQVWTQQITSSKLLMQLLKRYHRENAVQFNQGIHKPLRYTPWTNLMGNDPKMVFKVYHNDHPSLKIIEIKPESGMHLLQTLSHLIGQIPNPKPALTPMRISGIHVCSLLPTHPSLSLCTSKEAMYQHVILPGKSISCLPLMHSLQKKLISYSLQFINHSAKETFLKLMSESKKPLILKDFRNKIIASSRDHLLPGYSLQKIAPLIDLQLVKSLPDKYQKNFQQSFIHIADSNWQKDGHDIHYAIGLNPGTAELELISILDNGTLYEFLNQNFFLKLHSWEVWL